MKKIEVDDLDLQELDSIEDHLSSTEPGMERRRFFGGLAAVIGATAAMGGVAAAQEKGGADAKEAKNKILSRIQQQLNQEEGEEGMMYIKSYHQLYIRGGDPPPTIRWKNRPSS